MAQVFVRTSSWWKLKAIFLKLRAISRVKAFSTSMPIQTMETSGRTPSSQRPNWKQSLKQIPCRTKDHKTISRCFFMNTWLREGQHFNLMFSLQDEHPFKATNCSCDLTWIVSSSCWTKESTVHQCDAGTGVCWESWLDLQEEVACRKLEEHRLRICSN